MVVGGKRVEGRGSESFVLSVVLSSIDSCFDVSAAVCLITVVVAVMGMVAGAVVEGGVGCVLGEGAVVVTGVWSGGGEKDDMV